MPIESIRKVAAAAAESITKILDPPVTLYALDAYNNTGPCKISVFVQEGVGAAPPSCGLAEALAGWKNVGARWSGRIPVTRRVMVVAQFLQCTIADVMYLKIWWERP